MKCDDGIAMTLFWHIFYLNINSYQLKRQRWNYALKIIRVSSALQKWTIDSLNIKNSHGTRIIILVAIRAQRFMQTCLSETKTPLNETCINKAHLICLACSIAKLNWWKCENCLWMKKKSVKDRRKCRPYSLLNLFVRSNASVRTICCCCLFLNCWLLAECNTSEHSTHCQCHQVCMCNAS